MRSWARWGACAPLLGLLACTINNGASSSSSSGGGCGAGGGDFGSFAADAPDKPEIPQSPDGPAPTGTRWKAEATDEGCGRSGLRWVLVDEVCGDGEGLDGQGISLLAPMFRDGAAIGANVFAVDATHLWSIDASDPTAPRRDALLTGLGQPIAARARGSELLLASMGEGLVFVDATTPSSPTRTGAVALPGPALDVDLDGSRAFVAMGSAGLGVVRADGTRALERTIAIPGFAAGVRAQGDYAYVAACTTFSVVDLRSGAVVGSTWLPNAKQGKRLVAPAKDVELVGSTAYVAAGRYGAVAIDVSNPQAPKIRGNCTHPDESFWASGVRAEGGKVYVAGGEWGVDTVLDSKSSCGSTVDPPAPPPDDVGCSGKPPWEVLPWERLWAPPPPGKDPVQVLPSGGALYAFGDARRVGVRAVEIKSTTGPSLVDVGRYDEPRAVLGVAATADRVVILGPRGGLFRVDPAAELARVDSVQDARIAKAAAAAFLPDGRYALLSAAGDVFVEGASKSTSVPGASALAAVDGGTLALALPSTLASLDVAAGAVTYRTYGDTPHLPVTLAAGGGTVVWASPEWTAARRATKTLVGPLPVHGAFDAEDSLDVSEWRARLPRRQLAVGPRGPVEVAVLGGRAAIAVHAATGTERAPLPALTYAGLAVAGDRAYALAIDRALYRSYLVTVSIAAGAPRVLSVESFTGAGAGLAAAGARLYVADADGAMRVYRTDTVGAPSLVTTLRLEDRP